MKPRKDQREFVDFSSVSLRPPTKVEQMVELLCGELELAEAKILLGHDDLWVHPHLSLRTLGPSKEAAITVVTLPRNNHAAFLKWLTKHAPQCVEPFEAALALVALENDRNPSITFMNIEQEFADSFDPDKVAAGFVAVCTKTKP